MIPRTPLSAQRAAWQEELAHAVTDPEQLLRLLDLDTGPLPAARAAARLFPLRVPRPYLRRIRKGDLHDPLLRQVLPLGEECRSVPGFGTDPVGDMEALAAPGLLHKYHGRVLLVATGACAVHCRYCFRRHFPYAQTNPAANRWNSVLAYLATRPNVCEVVLSGGDPLALGDNRLAALADDLSRIPHLKRLRIHTRLPVVLPSRVDHALLEWLSRGRLQKVVVVHVNHPREIDGQVREAFARLAAGGATLLNQSVLLRGVNDDEETLVQLSEALFDAGVLPYYLHLLDRVAGAAHFEVGERKALALMETLNARLPGYLVPRLAREQPGAPGKRLFSPFTAAHGR